MVVVACVVSAVVVVAIVGVVVGVCAYKQHSAQMRYNIPSLLVVVDLDLDLDPVLLLQGEIDA